jgi:hypothetical protein
MQQISPSSKKMFLHFCASALAILCAEGELAASANELKPPTKLIAKAGAKSTRAKRSSAAAAGKAPAWVKGVVYGEKFEVRKAFYGEGYLFLRSEFKPAPTTLNEANRPDACNGIQVAVPTREGLEGRTFVVRLGDAQETKPEVNLYAVMESGSVDVHLFQKVKVTSPFSMVLRFFKITDGLLPGYIELHCTDTTSHPTTISGYFYAQPGTGNAVRPYTLF